MSGHAVWSVDEDVIRFSVRWIVPALACVVARLAGPLAVAAAELVTARLGRPLAGVGVT